MEIRRYSVHFLLMLAVIALTLAAAAAAAFSQQVTVETCRAVGLPILFVETEYGKVIKSKESYLSATYSLQAPSQQNPRTYMVENAGACKIRGRGNTTWSARKKPYLLKLDRAAPLLGMAQAEKWVLLANYYDKTSLRNAYATHLANAVWTRQEWVPAYRFITLFVNGRYEGLYQLYEKVERVPGRLELPDGSFFWVVNSHQDREWNFWTANFVPLSMQDNGADEAAFRAQQAYLQRAEDALFSADFTDARTGWRAFLDEESFVDWFLLNEYAKNRDSIFQSSCYLFFDAAKGKLCMGPSWDFDIGFGASNSFTCADPEGWWVNMMFWYKRLFEDESFVRAVRARWAETAGNIPASLGWLTEQAGALSAAAALNESVWHTFGKRVWPHTPGWKTRKTYAAEVAYLTDWCTRRAAWIDGELGAGAGATPMELEKSTGTAGAGIAESTGADAARRGE